jgi:hypothetical protein
MKASKAVPHDTKWVFIKQGTCSRTFMYILNREFGNPMETEERAADPLAGGIMQQGYQCGMLWGSALAVGAESFRWCGNCDQGIGLAITATQTIMASFLKRAKNTDCFDITKADFTKKYGIAKYLIFGKALTCIKLADKWAPEAIRTAVEALSYKQAGLPQQPVSCASEVVKKMGGSEKEMVMVAGFAGGLGLSGNACGALSASIWMKTLKWCRENPGKALYPNPKAKETLEEFLAAVDYEFLCHKISGQRFQSTEDHTQFIKSGGCDKLIDLLARS